jgi:hypothetical protein
VKTKTTPSFALSAAFLALGNEVLDPAAKKAVATDGEAIAILSLPDDFTGPAPEQTYDLAGLVTVPAYRVAINPEKLAALAAALGAGDTCILEFPAMPEEGPMKMICLNSDSIGYLMPQAMPAGTPEGILLPTATGTAPVKREAKQPKTPAKLPPPVVTANAERHTLEITFGGVPDKEIREALKDPALAFRYSGRGTRRGVPANTWYGPDNPFTRKKISALLKVEVATAKAA